MKDEYGINWEAEYGWLLQQGLHWKLRATELIRYVIAVNEAKDMDEIRRLTVDVANFILEYDSDRFINLKLEIKR
jgi:hypothetical protein